MYSTLWYSRATSFVKFFLKVLNIKFSILTVQAASFRLTNYASFWLTNYASFWLTNYASFRLTNYAEVLEYDLILLRHREIWKFATKPSKLIIIKYLMKKNCDKLRSTNFTVPLFHSTKINGNIKNPSKIFWGYIVKPQYIWYRTPTCSKPLYTALWLVANHYIPYLFHVTYRY